MLRWARRGQTLVPAALAMSLVLLSTSVYVYSNSRFEPSPNYSYMSDYALSAAKGSFHVVTASLVNVSRGGASSNLGTNLDRWESFVGDDYRFGRVDMEATLEATSPYSDGVYLNWGTSGVGVSSACADFVLNLSGRGAEIDWGYSVNMTTSVEASGTYTNLGGDRKDVAVTLGLYNEGSPALGGSTTLEYLKSGQWENASQATGYSRTDYGNGTYRFIFNDDIPGTPVYVRVKIYDRRGVFVQAEATLAEV